MLSILFTNIWSISYKNIKKKFKVIFRCRVLPVNQKQLSQNMHSHFKCKYYYPFDFSTKLSNIEYSIRTFSIRRFYRNVKSKFLHPEPEKRKLINKIFQIRQDKIKILLCRAI